MFAELSHVKLAYEGDIPETAEARVQYLLDTVSARLRVLLPDLVERAADDADLTLLARDVIVQAVIRRMPGATQQVRSESQGVGPWSTTVTYTTDSTGTFSDEDLAVLGGMTKQTSGRVGTIRTGSIDWSAQW